MILWIHFKSEEGISRVTGQEMSYRKNVERNRGGGAVEIINISDM
jgi:hypothetical protein